MKSTGIVRRLDDLGRLVIPKEIRKQYRLKEGDSIEFFTEGERIIIQKYDLMSRHQEEIKIMCDTLEAMYGNTVLYVQDDPITINKRVITNHFVAEAKVHRISTFDGEEVYERDATTYSGIIFPIVAYGDWYGSFVMLFDKKSYKEDELVGLDAFTKLLTRQQEQ